MRMHCITQRPPLPQPSTSAEEKGFCGALLCHNLQTYFPDKSQADCGNKRLHLQLKRFGFA